MAKLSETHDNMVCLRMSHILRPWSDAFIPDINSDNAWLVLRQVRCWV